MDIELSEQQRLIQGSARDFLSGAFDGAAIRAARSGSCDLAREHWEDMANLGWMGIRVPEEHGGIGGSFIDLLVLMEEMGRVTMPGPFFSTAVVAVEILRQCGDQLSCEDLFPKIISGEARFAVVVGEGGGDLDPDAIAIQAEQSSNGYQLNGIAHFVRDGQDADYLLCAANMGMSGNASKCICIFQVPVRLAGIEVTPLITIGGTTAARIVFDNVQVNEEDMVANAIAWPVLERAILQAAVAKCAEMIGAASRVLEIAVAYAKERQQFGQIIGSFQAIQHHCADMLTDLDGARWITWKTGWLIDEGLATRREMAMAKTFCNSAYRRIVRLGHQIMGGIGYCEEHDMPLFFRHARLAESAYGESEDHLNIIAAELVAKNS